MAGTYNQGIARTGYEAGADYLVPNPVAAEIIQELPKQSALLQRARSVPMSSNTYRMPVLDVLPMAYWVGGDTGLKQTTRQMWTGIELVVEELAAIVPIPEAYLADAQVDLWGEVKPRLAAACGMMIDQAGIFGVNKPSTWPTDIYHSAVNAGNVVAAGSGVDLAQDVGHLGKTLRLDGFALNGFMSAPGFSWDLTNIRTEQGLPIYQGNLQTGDPQAGVLYGRPVSEVDNGAWDASAATLIGGAWDNAVIGIRSDISFKMFDQGVISDDTGKVILNLLQQDSVAWRVVMRVAYAIANPVTELNADRASRSPFAVLTPGSAAS
ncbi:MAG: phage major capsid protein [Streptosporangiaceae bacterium]|nr:phage major capsid protein [Streptosporangiaceae bacterium]